MEHKQVRFLTPNFPKDKIDEEVEREDLRRISPASNAALSRELEAEELGL